ncbi:RagB/SusD family nutrient uptake outer membrane protein [Neotamlana laminarinivorans]|uniref:RagB/SusD family nutrient uptake outer membrane protein n=1 Tax=Neotamlana laminarinivorans TaxID=2883124 RepID=A0A9X1I252_9FLAO|nr:RagB/SusD family nutrient uptake outer membrane protein [Tamlana laminarinivorans]MCB4799233.1 RagB/SusD family nutrient uptake outer membrane protein [Tamlana laminarinivorans]
MRKQIYLALTMLVFTLVSCSEEYLENVPTDSISEAAALSSPENMELILEGLHRMMYAQTPLEGATWSRTGESHFIPSLDAIGGSIIHSSPGNGWMSADLAWNMHTNSNSTTLYNFWFQRYHFVASANSIINEIENNNYTYTEQINNILAQSYAYRAWAYWRLVTTFSKGYIIGDPSTDLGVPLLLEKGAPYESAPRGTVQDVYDQIESDINKSVTYFQNASAPDNKSQISINAAYGIKARIALSKGDWSTAAESAELARNGYPIMGESEWLSGFNTYDLSEVIWGGQVIDTETNYFASYFYYVAFAFNGSQNRSNPKLISKELYDAIPDTDYRNQAWLPLAPNTNPSASNDQGGSYLTDPNYDNEDDFWDAWSEIIETYGATTAHNTHPYMNVKFKQENPGSIDPDDVIYMRSSEMVLIEAEAKAMMNDISGAQDALDILGSARDTAFDKTAYATQNALMEQIKWQRKVELWGEGFSYHDAIRWDEAIDHTNSGASFNLYQDGFMQDRPSINDDWIFKIPQQEIDANPYITEAEQN